MHKKPTTDKSNNHHQRADRQKTSAFARSSADEQISQEDVEKILRALDTLAADAHPASEKKATAHLRDALLSFKILPENNPRKYMDRAEIKPNATDSIAQDWENIGLDLWSSLLAVRRKRLSTR